MDIKSSWLSKINWTQFIGFAAMILTVFGIEMPDEVKVQIVALIGSAQAILTWVLRTWFTKSLTKASVPAA
jgi:hypothetical protein